MTPFELLMRVRFTLWKSWWKKQKQWESPLPTLRKVDRWNPKIAFDRLNKPRQAIVENADSLINGKLILLNTVFNIDALGWHLDPESGKRSPLNFAFDIDYRNRNNVGNIKNIWEINRHQYLVPAAYAYAMTKNVKYADEITKHLSSWLESNPFLKGVNWHSSLELGLRLISWVWIERLLRDSPNHEILFGPHGRLWPAIYRHQWLIHKNPSYGSSANNHLIGELAGLFIAATVWPYFSESAQWADHSQQILEQEITKQTFASGLNRELAFSYHLFSIELFLLSALEAKRADKPFSRQSENDIRRMAEVIPLVTDVASNLPRYGDEDGGVAICNFPYISRLDWIYSFARIAIEANVPDPSENSAFTEILDWYQSEQHEPSFCPATGSSALEDAGLYVLANRRNQADEIFCLVDAGPLGFLRTAAHGHADALSFTLSVSGIPIIVDPGTYTYFTESYIRDYFRSTLAHNTIVIDQLSQSVPEGAFLWGKKANCNVLDWSIAENYVELCAEHDGYLRLPGRVTHRRRLRLDRIKNTLLVSDQVIGKNTHNLDWRLHFHPKCTVELANHSCRIKHGPIGIELTLDPMLNWELLRGQPNGGWYSPGFNLRTPTFTLCGAAKSQLPLTLETTLHIITS
jgi:hypothetical protein